jgi:hypothetical protein
MQTQITDTIVSTSTFEEGVQEVHALHAKGHAAKLVGPMPNEQWLALDLDAPIVDIVDALFDAGLSANEAEDRAWRYLQQGC